MNEQEIREQIAKEIEAYAKEIGCCETHKQMHEYCWECWQQYGFEQSAAIARGQK